MNQLIYQSIQFLHTTPATCKLADPVNILIGAIEPSRFHHGYTLKLAAFRDFIEQQILLHNGNKNMIHFKEKESIF